MDELTIEELHALRLTIFDNAEALQHEAKLLLEHGHWSRAYLLAYFCCEELGKIPIVVGAIGQLMLHMQVDWKKVNRRFRSHAAKIESDDFHHYMFALDPDPLRNTDVQWLEEADRTAPARLWMKNDSTYVDVRGHQVVSPLKTISEQDARDMVDRAFESLKAHWHAESMTNPIVVAAEAVNERSSASG